MNQEEIKRMNNYDKILEMMALGRSEAAKRIQLNKHILFDLLDSKNISNVVVNFDGSGDSGGVEQILLHPRNEDSIHFDSNAICAQNVEGAKVLHGTRMGPGGWEQIYEEGPITVKSLIENICYDALKAEHEGWENNDGAYGEISFYCEDRSVKMEYYERETKFFEHEF